MQISEHSIVVLNRDIPPSNLLAGDVGTVVHTYEGQVAYEVEFVVGDGSTVALLTLDAQDIRPLAAAELLHARSRA